MNFKIYVKLFDSTEVYIDLELLEETCVAFFRNLGPATQRIEMWENTSNIEGEPSWRVTVAARREKIDQRFLMTREFNIF